MITHCFSLDVEEFCEGLADVVSIDPALLHSVSDAQDLDANIADVLDFLDEFQIKGTFFVLGRVADKNPFLVRRIAARQHEIGSHGLEHRLLYNIPKANLVKVISRSKKILEDCVGCEVKGFRAPFFSVTEDTLYVLDAIQESGFAYDSSVFPIRGHDVYGIGRAPMTIHVLANGLIEYPPTAIEWSGVRVPALGGGYFRLYPFLISKMILRRINASHRPAMFFIHPFEMAGRCPRLDSMSLLRRFRRYHNISKTTHRFRELFREFKFGRAVDILISFGHDV